MYKLVGRQQHSELRRRKDFVKIISCISYGALPYSYCALRELKQLNHTRKLYPSGVRLERFRAADYVNLSAHIYLSVILKKDWFYHY